MVENKGVTTNVQLKTFDGLKANCGTWMTYFKGTLMVKNPEDVMLPMLKNELPDSETAKEQNTKQKKAVEQNKAAMRYSGMALVSSQWTVKVAKTKTDEWPRGRAYVITEMLQKKYRSKDIFS